MLFLTLGISLLCECSTNEIPDKWKDLKITDKGLVEIEKETDENGLYLKYEGISRDDLLRNVSHSLVASNYKEVGTAFKGSVIGFIKGDDKLAVKIDQFDKTLYLAIFNEKGKGQNLPFDFCPLKFQLVFGYISSLT